MICIASWLFAFSILSDLPFLAIDSVEIRGADSDIVPMLQAAALQALAGSYGGMFSRADRLIYPRAAVAAAVAAVSPRVASVSMGTDGANMLTVTVMERQPSAVICPDLPDLDSLASTDSSDECFLADSDGLIFEPASSTTVAMDRYYVPGLADDASLTADFIGEYATSSAEFAALQGFYEGARQAGIAVQAVLMKDGGEYELYAQNPGAAGSTSTEDADIAVVYFNDNRPLSDELSDLTAFWTHMRSLPPDSGHPLDFESIDVRYGSNVFYRLNQ